MSLRLAAVLSVVVLSGCNGPVATATLAITGVTVIDVRDGSRIQDAVLVVEGTRFRAVGPGRETAIPAASRVVDARGKYVIPGLWEMHAHIMSPAEAEVFFPLFVAHGIVGIRDAGGDVGGDEGLTPSQFRDLAARLPYAPQIAACGASIDGPALRRFGAAAIVDKQAGQGVACIKLMSLIPRAGLFDIMARARERGLPVVGHVPIGVSAAEASDLGVRTLEHALAEILVTVSKREPALRAERLAAAGSGLSPGEQEMLLFTPPTEALFSTWRDDKAAALFHRFVANHTWNTPTLMIFAVRRPALSDDTAFWNDPNLTLVPRAWVDSWRPEHTKHWLAGVPRSDVPAYLARFATWNHAQLDLVRRMHVAGVGFLAGTDVSNWNMLVPGVSLHDELGQFVEAGLSPLEALQTATINPARYLGIEDSVGTVAAGKRADLVLLDADPTASISNTKKIAAVLLGGRLIERNELNRILDDARRRAAEGPPQ